jgi:hypothetical protein
MTVATAGVPAAVFVATVAFAALVAFPERLIGIVRAAAVALSATVGLLFLRCRAGGGRVGGRFVGRLGRCGIARGLRRSGGLDAGGFLCRRRCRRGGGRRWRSIRFALAAGSEDLAFLGVGGGAERFFPGAGRVAAGLGLV